MRFKLASREDLMDALTATTDGAFHNQFVQRELYPILAQHGDLVVTPERVALMLLEAITAVHTTSGVNLIEDFEKRACAWLRDLCNGEKRAWLKATMAWERNWRELQLKRGIPGGPFCWEEIRMELVHPDIEVEGSVFKVLACRHTDVDCFVYKDDIRKRQMLATYDLKGKLVSNVQFL